MSSTFSMLALFVVPLLSVLIPILIGEYYGIRIKKKHKEINESPVGSVVAAAMGLLAFMLAFTFQIVSNRFDARKEMLLSDATNIRTAYLRAGLLPEPYAGESKKLIFDLLQTRVDLINSPDKVKEIIPASFEILDKLWKVAEDLAVQDRSSEIYSLFTSSVNDLIDVQNQRITIALEYRIPSEVLWVLFVISFFSMLALGYQFGISGKGNILLNLVLSVIFAVVMFLIFALDRPELGLVEVNQQPMLNLQQQLLKN